MILKSVKLQIEQNTIKVVYVAHALFSKSYL